MSSLSILDINSLSYIWFANIFFHFTCFGGGLITKSCPAFAIPWTIAHQDPLSMGFSKQEYWRGCHFFPQGHSQPRDQTCYSCIAGSLLHCEQILYHWGTRETLLHRLLFILFLMVSFAIQKLLPWCSPILFLLLVSNPKNHWQDQCQGAYTICLLLEILWFKVLQSNL